MEPLVSVAVFTYNQEKYVVKTLDNIFNQERDFPIEILINDDGSSDQTPEIIRSYAEKYPDIVRLFLRPANMGLIKCYYDVINNCNGKYIMNIAGDDYWLPGKIKTQIEYMEEHQDVGLSYGITKRLHGENYISNFGNANGTVFELNILHNCIPALTVCMRRNVLMDYLHVVNPALRRWKAEDYPMQLWFAKNSKIGFIERELGVYRILDNSISHPIDLKEKLSFMDSMQNMKEYFAEGDSAVQKQIREVYALEVGNVYMNSGNIVMFRKWNIKAGKKGLIKNIISYIPGGIKILKYRESKLVF